MVFKEKLSKKNYMGLGLTLLAIFLIYLGDKTA
jgi:multidrug transporter EmrE-like cation transporter